MVRPIDFITDMPPARTIGTECEYNMQSPDGTNYHNHYVVSDRLNKRGVNNHNGYLGHGYGSGRTYPDVSHLEFATKEAIGPAAAAVEDVAGIHHLAAIVATESSIVHSGLYRVSGTFIPNGKVENTANRINGGRTSGYHENYLIGRAFVDDPLVDALIPTVLASRLWAMNGTLRHTGYVLSQKIWGIGGKPVERALDRRTDHGQKPMVIIPPVASDNDTIGKDEWARVEVRMSDPGLSLVGRFTSFANMSLALRLIEQSHRIGPDKIGSLCLQHPVEAAKAYAGDLNLTAGSKTTDGRQLSALDIQESLLDLFEPLSETVCLPTDEKFAIGVLRQLVDALRTSNPAQAEYSTNARLRVEFAAKHQFISKDTEQKDITPHNLNQQQRSLLWNRITPEGNGLKFWNAIEAKDPLVGTIRQLAASAGTLPRSERRADMIDRDNGELVISWSKYRSRHKDYRSLGSPIGD